MKANLRKVLATARVSLLIGFVSSAAFTNAAAQPESGALSLAPLSETFWRPHISARERAAEITVYIHSDQIEIASRCYFNGLTPDWSPKAAPFGHVYASSGTLYGNCKALQADFDAFVSKVKQTASFKPDGHKLYLFDRSGQLLVELFRSQTSGIEQHWLTVLTYSDGGTLVPARSLGNAVPQFILFGGQIEGTLGCGSLDGGYVINGTAISLSPSLFTVFDGCAHNEDAALHQENLISEQLSNVRRVGSRGRKHFVLFDKQGHIRIELSAAKERAP